MLKNIYFLLIFIVIFNINLYSQGVAINTTGSIADSSAILDISASNKGLLIPRMSEIERNAIIKPAVGLLIFNTTTNCFNFWDGNLWKQSCFDCLFNTPYVGNNGPVCEGSDIYLMATSISGATYQWTGPNGFSSNVQNPVIPNATTLASGPYTLVITLNNCTSTPITTFVTVNPRPTAPVVTSNSPVCEGDTLKINSSFVQGAIYSWSGPNGFSSNVQNPTIPNVSVYGTGIYNVIATVNGCSSPPSILNVNVIPISTGKLVYNYTGYDQTFEVPECVNTIKVKVWGAGGGGFNTDKGGGGGYSTADISVIPGEILTVIVGSGGKGICNGQCSGLSCGSVYGGGGGTYEGNGGGGLSGIFRNTTPLVIAGGGGGGGGGNNSSPGGAGGGLNGLSASDATYGGKGGSQVAGGAGGASTLAPYPGTGGYLTGANSNLGGAGGGGYYGGGGGGRAGSWLHRGGGGGSGYISTVGTSNAQTIAGSGNIPANNIDPDYVSGIGVGGSNGNGGNGYVVIIW